MDQKADQMELERKTEEPSLLERMPLRSAKILLGAWRSRRGEVRRPRRVAERKMLCSKGGLDYIEQ